jgi:hypothetical protein
MNKTGILAAATILASALAAPAMAQDVTYMAQDVTYYGPGTRQVYQDQAHHGRAYRDHAWRDSYNRWDDDSGFWPGAVAAGVAAGAVGTAATITASPIGGDEYARRNGFVCIPGSWFRGEDGLMHICQ